MEFFMKENQLDAERQKKAIRYARIQRRLMVIELALAAVYIIVWLFAGWSFELKNYLLLISAQRWFQILIFTYIFGGFYILLTLPLSYYEGFLLPRQFELSNQTLKLWISDQLKSFLISALLGSVLIEIFYLFLTYFPFTWWLFMGIFMIIINVILTNLAPVILFPIFYKFSPLEDERHELGERLTRLAGKASTKIQGVYKFDLSRRTKAANAALAGLGNTRRLILGDTLLSEFNDDEIEIVLAHELGHHVHNDIPLGIGIGSILTFGGLYLANLGLKWGIGHLGFSGIDDFAALPLFVLVFGIYSLITMPLGNSYSRWREHKADVYALEITRKPNDFISAMTRLANQNLTEVEPESWVEFFLYSHPSLSKRIKLAQEWKVKAQNLQNLTQ
jgi:STE24 endopeptidase